MNSVEYLLFYMELLNYSFCDMFGSVLECYELFYHDVGENFWPQPIRSLKLGHVTGQGSMSPTWVGRVSDPGKNGSHKKCKNLDNIAVYLIASLKSKWKKYTNKN